MVTGAGMRGPSCLVSWLFRAGQGRSPSCGSACGEFTAGWAGGKGGDTLCVTRLTGMVRGRMCRTMGLAGARRSGRKRGYRSGHCYRRTFSRTWLCLDWQPLTRSGCSRLRMGAAVWFNESVSGTSGL